MITKKEMYSGIFFIVLSVLYLIGTFFIKEYNAFGDTGINSASIPKVLAYLMLILGSFQCVVGYKAYKRDTSPKEEVTFNIQENNKSIIQQSIDAEEALLADAKEDKKSIALTFIFLFLLAIFIESIGFIIMSTFFLVAQMTLLTSPESRSKKLPFIIVISAVFSVVVYMLFTRGFSLLLPSGVLG
ncbi:tripartite tricarboxylate transporter TctB family protein [Tissierella sp. Yu-01]|uniref:tripartite tricarboxylate transporter TctB family protein n=1 Tax=Tissierella sp. Yu-01 TaxID=3035694 RepID=UPI00240D998F|nr:tripartite tricarboxylate transporter TctB family protein [Tissierella sp. Yu-01]WFA08070.1 tripartite tricarboxylate transporter TctB family protein [Tissierella sp. Yu-01]